MAVNSGTTSIENPQSLRDAGGWAVQVSGRIRAIGGHPKKDTENAAHSFSSSKWDGELGGALRTLADHWEKKSRKLAADCNSLGESCTRTADNYLKTEKENSDSQSAIHQQIKGDFG